MIWSSDHSVASSSNAALRSFGIRPSHVSRVAETRGTCPAALSVTVMPAVAMTSRVSSRSWMAAVLIVDTRRKSTIARLTLSRAWMRRRDTYSMLPKWIAPASSRVMQLAACLLRIACSAGRRLRREETEPRS